jgi:hypothetical protein
MPVFYGVSFTDKMPNGQPAQWTDIVIEAKCFLRGGTLSTGGISKAQHFKNVAKIMWGPKSKKRFIWHPWADDMLEEACQQQWLYLSGAASTGKTDFLAIWGIINWMCSPPNTLVLFTSTSLKEARQRVWGSVLQYYGAYCDTKGKPILPGKIIDSVGMIRTVNGTEKYSDKCGMHLITGEKSKERENIGKLIGLKNKRVFLLADELPELSPALIEAAKSNLIANPQFQMIGAGNFKSIYDPFGSESEPVNGWASVNPEHARWETKNGGVCLRFDGIKSPNILAGEDKYPIYGCATYEKHKSVLGENTAAWWRMVRSFPCPDADANRIYSDADFIRGLVHERVRWQSQPTRVASLDPAFATGGDKAIAYIGSYGMSTEGKWTLQYDKRVEIREDVRKKDESRSLQVAKGYRDLCIAEKVAPENAAYDASGGGLVFGSLLGEIWSLKLLGVQFGGAASDRPVSVKDKRPAKDAFVNRVTELWFGGVDFVHSSQIKGLSKEAAEELKERRYETIKGMTMRTKVEPKSDMKLRINRSPDDGDSALILLELCRSRFNFVPEGMEGVRKQTSGSFKQRAMLINRVYQNVNYEPEEVAA